MPRPNLAAQWALEAVQAMLGHLVEGRQDHFVPFVTISSPAEVDRDETRQPPPSLDPRAPKPGIA